MYQQSQKDNTAGLIVEEDAKDVADTAKGVVKDPEGAAQRAIN